MADFEEIIKKHIDESGNIPSSAIGTVVAAIKTAVGNEFVDKTRYKAKLDEIDELKTKQQTAEDNATTAEKWKTKYEALKDEFGDFKKQQTAKATHEAKEKAYREVLKEAGISEKRIDAVLKVSNVDDIELESDGKIKEADKLTDSIKNEWADFIVTTEKRGANPANPPSNTGGKVTRESIMAIKDRAERRAAIAQNLNLFNGGNE